MTGGAPNISALRPQVYWPGRRWVDWVGTSFYSRFPNFTGLDRFYKDFALGKRKPFAIAEWAIWGADAPGFADRLFDWIGAHKQVKMVHYNQGGQSDGIFRLGHYPASARVIRGPARSAALPRVRARAALAGYAERRGDHAPVGRRGGRDALAPRRRSATAKMPRRSSAHMARHARPSSSSRATTREQVLCVRWTPSASSCIRTLPCGTLAEPGEHLVLDRREVVLALELALQRRVDGGVGRVERAPGRDRIGGGVGWHWARHAA